MNRTDEDSALPVTEGCFPGGWIGSPSLSISEGEYLPRWSVDRAVYHVAFHLADAIPVPERAKWREIRESLVAVARQVKRELTQDERALLKAAYDERIERYLASGNGACLLRDMATVEAVGGILEYGNGKDYALHCWCVMPNHLHVVVAFEKADDLSRTVARWKRISAHQINRLAGRKGPVWMDDAYTRIIRSQEEYRHQLSYVWNNPESARLASGFRRRRYVEW